MFYKALNLTTKDLTVSAAALGGRLLREVVPHLDATIQRRDYTTALNQIVVLCGYRHCFVENHEFDQAVRARLELLRSRGVNFLPVIDAAPRDFMRRISDRLSLKTETGLFARGGKPTEYDKLRADRAALQAKRDQMRVYRNQYFAALA